MSNTAESEYLDTSTQKIAQEEERNSLGNQTMDDLNISANLELEVLKHARVIKPYNGELMPKGFLHGAFSFAATFAKTYKGPESVQQVLGFLAPKLDEFAGYRRFKTEMLHNGPVSKIGKGRFGDVWRMTFGSGGRDVAVKQFKDLTNPLAIYKEVHTLIAVQHKRVVQLLGSFHDQGTYMVMQLCLGSLRMNLGVLTPLQIVRFCIQLLEGLRHIHSMNIIHCDVRPENCLITKENNIVLADFGDAQLLPKNAEFIRVGDYGPLLGCKGYCDDVANSGTYSKSTDMFGLACVLFEMETGRGLMQYKNWPDAPRIEYIRIVKEGRLLHYPPEHFPDAGNAEKMWNLEGDRETLLHRSTSAPIFCSILKDMVHHSYKRMGAAELLKRYKGLFDRHLTNKGLSMDQIDKDVDVGDVRLHVDNIRGMRQITCSNDMNIAMDLIYYDSELNIPDPRTENVKEQLHKDFEAIPTEFLKCALDKLISGNSVRVHQSGDGLPLPHPSTCEFPPLPTAPISLHTFKAVLQNVKTASTIHDLEEKKKNGATAESSSNGFTCVKEPVPTIENSKAAANLTRADTSIDHNVKEPVQKRKKSTPKSTLTGCENQFKMPNAKESPGSSAGFKAALNTEVFEKSPSPPELRNTKAYNGTALRNQPINKSTCSKSATTTEENGEKATGKHASLKRKTDSSSSDEVENEESKKQNKDMKQGIFRSVMEPLASGSHSCVRHKSKKKKAKVDEDEKEKRNQSLKTARYVDSLENSDSEPEIFRFVFDRNGKKTKWWYITHQKTVPLELRGVAPPPKNLPFGFRADEDWSGWFDCNFCDLYYTHDYKKVKKHMSRCKKSN